MKINVITAVSRPENLYVIKSVINQEIMPYFDTTWYCIYDIGKDNPIMHFTEKWIYSLRGGCPNDCSGGSQRNVALDMIKDGWNYFLDDDNIFFNGYGELMRDQIKEHHSISAFVVSQKRESGDLLAVPEYMKPGHLDIAQFLIKTELIGKRRFFEDVYQSDFFFIKKLYKENKDKFMFINKFFCHYNFLRK